MSSSWKSPAPGAGELWPGEAAVPGLALSKLTWKGTSERVSPVCDTGGPGRTVFGESGCLGLQPKVGGKLHLKLNTGTRPIANKYREGKVKSTLKKSQKDRETVRRETNAAEVAPRQAQGTSSGLAVAVARAGEAPCDRSALLRGAGQRQLRPAQKGAWVGGSVLCAENL